MVIDSHVLYWWLDGFPRLSKRALDVLENAAVEGALLKIAAVTLWEFADKERQGKFVSRQPVAMWPKLLHDVAWLKMVDTSAEIWLTAAALDWDHRDPADRIIAATALIHGVPVLTKDRVFHEKGCPVKAVW
jgi:PIN domain nuclease of toxin-antitoxin system